MTEEQREKFKPRPGQTDYTDIREAPVINSLVECAGRMLLVRRSQRLSYYPGYWSGISGFLDDGQSPEEKLKDEIKEELGLSDGDIQSIELGESFRAEDKRYSKDWIVHPLRAVILKKELHLNWEADEFVWILSHDIYNYDLVPGYDHIVRIFHPEA
ncbi:MAG: NUDIX domain-containing protein [Candidatus Liptonbacteria bacterium]